MNLNDLKKVLEKSWDEETCYPELRDDWSPEKPSLGQCAVTALVVQDYFGGELLYCKHHHHYWNRISTGEEVDLTRDQFPEGTEICLDYIRSRNHLLNGKYSKKAGTAERYELLKDRVDNEIKKDILLKYYRSFLERYEEIYGDRIFLIDVMKKLDETFETPKVDPVFIEEDDLKLLTNDLDFEELKKMRETFVKSEMKKFNLTKYNENDPLWDKLLYSSPIEIVMARPFAYHENLKFGGKLMGDFLLVLMEDYEKSKRMYYHIFKVE